MDNTIEYKNYIGTVEFVEGDNVFSGRVLNISNEIKYEGKNVKEFIDDFHKAINDYLKVCRIQGISPEKPCDGNLNVHISPEKHKIAIMLAYENNITLDRFVEEAITTMIVKDAYLLHTKDKLRYGETE